MNRKIAIVAGTLLCLISFLYGGTIFEDAFNNANNWVTVSGAPQTNCSGGLYNVIVPGGQQAIIKNSTALPAQYTYSAKFKVNTFPAQQAVGIIFNMQADMQCYVLFIANTRQYTFGKFVKSGSSLSFQSISYGWNSFISLDNNTLKVSKKNGETSLYCNGVLLERLTNSDFSAGNIGFFIGGGINVSFDHVLVTDQYKKGEYVTGFRDSFDDNDIVGWAPINNNPATVKSEGGVLKISNVNSQLTLFTSGLYKNKACTTIVTYKGGNKEALYGVNFFKMETPSITKSYLFWINANRKYAVCHTGTYLPHGPESYINGTTDTLVVSKDYKFYINGKLAYDSINDAGFDFNAVAFNVNPGVSIEAQIFKVGEPGGVPIIYSPNSNHVNYNPHKYLLGGLGLIYDTRGRKVASFEGKGYHEKLKDLSSGPYYIIMKGKKNHVIRRAIVNIK